MKKTKNMICPKCKKQITETAKFCNFCGSQIIKTAKKIFKSLPTTQGKRFANYIIDSIAIYVFIFVVGFILSLVGLYGLIENINNYLLGITLTLIFYTFFEYNWSKTPAKFITKTRVVMNNGKKPEFWDIVVRTLVRFIPFEAFSFLGSRNPTGWHDRWSKTMVIDDK